MSKPCALTSDFRPLTSFSRSGVTIIEVLFAILVTSVGLLGAIALFPVASAQARRARLNDMVGLAGRSAFHDFDARGMGRPDRWLAWDAQRPAALGGPAFVPALSVSNLKTAESFCIDPRMMASHTSSILASGVITGQFMGNQSASGNPPGGGYAVQTFPYLEPYVDTNNSSIFDSTEGYVDLNGNGAHDPPEYSATIFTDPVSGKSFDSSLMRRITLWDGGYMPNGMKRTMTLPMANSIFQIEDDVSYQRPENGNNNSNRADASKQNASFLPTGTGNSWGRRLADGKISWFATIVPIFDVSGLPSDEYTLSVVMLYDRPSRLDALDATMERVVNGTLQSDGATGGEILLTSLSPNPDQLKVRPNDWVMVSGTYDVSRTGAGPYVTRFQWYRVAECDQEPEATASGGFQMYATLVGQDWNMNFAHPPTAIGTGNVRVTLVQGAFAVYEKTISLEYGSTF
jgi:hypothetical protein